MRIALGDVRRRLGVSQQELAKRADVPQSTISMIESGERSNPGVRTLNAICEALGVQLADVCRPDDEEDDNG